MKKKSRRSKGAFILWTLVAALAAAGCSKNDVPVDETGYTTLPDGSKIPVANLSVRTFQNSAITRAVIENSPAGSIDTARFYGIHYSEEIEEVLYQLPAGSTIHPIPPTAYDSVTVTVNGVPTRKRDYWEAVEVYTITPPKGSAYSIAFKLEDYISDRKGPASEDEPDPNAPGTLFVDLFNASDPVPDQEIWKLCTYASNAWSQHFEHVEGYENVRVEEGMLKLKVSKEEGHYKNGGIRTTVGFPKDTRVEVKARLTKKVRGGFPAIWQMPVNGTPWPTAGEIDIMEWVQGTPNRIYQTLHYQYDKPDNTASVSPERDVTQWHTYAVERTDEKVTFFINGTETFSYRNEGVEKKYPFNQWDYDIILNFSLGGLLNGNMTWPGVIHDSDLPGEMWIDWVSIKKI